MDSSRCTTCAALLGPDACSSCGRTTRGGLRPGVWVLDRYRLTKALDDDGLGLGWLALDGAGHTVTLRVLHDALFRTPRALARFGEELRRFQGFSHPHAQPQLDFGALADGALTWVGAWHFGLTLATALGPGRMHPSDASRIVEQIARALGSLHHRGLTHGDVKPETVLCSDDTSFLNNGWLLNVGLFAALVASRDGEGAGTVLGTPAYMAPERFTGARPDARADLYALALVAYEMFEGRSPFDANTPWEWATSHLAREPRPWSTASPLTASPRMQAAISRGLQKQPEARFATAEEFLTAACEPAAALSAAVPFGPPGGAGPYRRGR